MKPTARPAKPHFSSGPCAKFPGWTVNSLADACVGRSHRAKDGKAKLSKVLDLSRQILGIPADYRIGIVPASDTGAFEMAMWSLLGPRPVDVLAWESFGSGWVTDIVKELKLKDVKTLKADYGKIADLAATDPSHDIVFTWNGTTSGVRVPNGDWIKKDRQGLTLCDATSAVFAMDIPWDKLDVVTWSWQKVLGGEAQHGMLVLSPRAVERIVSYNPPWPMPKLFRMKAGPDKLAEGIFKGDTINTPSMIAVEDQIVALEWAQKVGRAEGPHRPLGRQSQDHRRLGRAHAVGRLPGRRPGDPLLHLGLPEDHGTLGDQARCRETGGGAEEDRLAARKGRRRLRHRRLSRRAAGHPDLGRRHGREVGSRSAVPVARLGLRAGRSRVRQSRLTVCR